MRVAYVQPGEDSLASCHRRRYSRTMVSGTITAVPPSAIPGSAAPLLVVDGHLVLALVAALLAIGGGMLARAALASRAPRRPVLHVVERSTRETSRDAA